MVGCSRTTTITLKHKIIYLSMWIVSCCAGNGIHSESNSLYLYLSIDRLVQSLSLFTWHDVDELRFVWRERLLKIYAGFVVFVSCISITLTDYSSFKEPIFTCPTDWNLMFYLRQIGQQTNININIYIYRYIECMWILCAQSIETISRRSERYYKKRKKRNEMPAINHFHLTNWIYRKQIFYLIIVSVR